LNDAVLGIEWLSGCWGGMDGARVVWGGA